MIEGRFVHCKLVVANLERSMKFYTSLFGLVPGIRSTHCKPAITEVPLANCDGVTIVVLMEGDVKETLPEIAGRAPLVLHVDDFDAARQSVEDSGYHPVVCPVRSAHLRLLFVADPDGHLVEIVSETECDKDAPSALCNRTHGGHWRHNERLELIADRLVDLGLGPESGRSIKTRTRSEIV